MRTFVTPDLHGRYLLALGLLQEVGIVDEQGARVRDSDVCSVQLGDLANCVAEDRARDAQLLRKARAWFDVCLIGNHEHPYFGGPAFSGFKPIAEIEQLVMNIPWRVALAVGDTLITHAGVAPWLDLPNAQVAERVLNEAWKDNVAAHPFLAAIGRARYGRSEYGGVLWRDAIEEPISDSFSQVFGHTADVIGPTNDYSPNAGTYALNLDCGGHRDVRRIVGAWLDEDGALLETVEYLLPDKVLA